MMTNSKILPAKLLSSFIKPKVLNVFDSLGFILSISSKKFVLPLGHLLHISVKFLPVYFLYFVSSFEEI